MATTKVRKRTKKPTPLSTRALAAYLTWKQFDLLLLLKQNSPVSTPWLAEEMREIKDYDIGHGGAFYVGVNYSSTYSSLRTLAKRQLVSYNVGDTGYVEWTITDRGRKALDWLER